jgi:hypothetical protein
MRGAGRDEHRVAFHLHEGEIRDAESLSQQSRITNANQMQLRDMRLLA